MPNDGGFIEASEFSAYSHGAALAIYLRFASCAWHEGGAFEIDFCGPTAVLIFHGRGCAAESC